MPTIQLLTWTPVTWMEAVGGMWEENLGLQTAVDLVEVGVYREKRVALHPEDYVGFSYGNFGVVPPTLYKSATISVTQPGHADAMMPAAAVQQVKDLEANEALAAPDRAAQIQAIRDANTDPEWTRYVDLANQAKNEVDESRRNDLLVQAAIAREETYVAIPVLWGGYNMMVKPHVRNLQVHGFPNVFQLDGVEISG